MSRGSFLFDLTGRGRALKASARAAIDMSDGAVTARVAARAEPLAARGRRVVMPKGRPHFATGSRKTAGLVNDFDSFATGGGRRGTARVPRRVRPPRVSAPRIPVSTARAAAANTARSAAGIPVIPIGVSPQAARQSAHRVAANATGALAPQPVRMLPTRRQAANAPTAARNGKMLSRAVIGAVAAAPIIGAFSHRTGPAADRGMGRPTGMYGY
jgi:hypothetical protein